MVDLARAHVVALERLLRGDQETTYEVFNVGTGTGSSVLEVIESFKRVSGQPLPYEVAPRRSGDVIAA